MSLEIVIQWVGGLLAYTTLGIILYGIWRGTQRQAGLTLGFTGSWLRSTWFYLALTLLFFGICYLLWIPVPQTFTPQARLWMLIFGSLLYFSGMSFTLWGRLALGKNYFVSTAFGAQLFADHQLITRGPFAIVRHPMYAGLFFAALGSLLIYATWTTLLFASFAPMLAVRARNEEQVLAKEFGEQWRDYCQQVPMFFLWIGKGK